MLGRLLVVRSDPFVPSLGRSALVVVVVVVVVAAAVGVVVVVVIDVVVVVVVSVIVVVVNVVPSLGHSLVDVVVPSLGHPLQDVGFPRQVLLPSFLQHFPLKLFLHQLHQLTVHFSGFDQPPFAVVHHLLLLPLQHVPHELLHARFVKQRLVQALVDISTKEDH